jgi:hypothetical protein
MTSQQYPPPTGTLTQRGVREARAHREGNLDESIPDVLQQEPDSSWSQLPIPIRPRDEYQQATIIEQTGAEQKPYDPKDRIIGTVLNVTGTIKDNATQAIEIASVAGGAIQKTAKGVGSAITEKAVELPDAVADMGRKYQEWLVTKNDEKAEREAQRNERTIESMKARHDIEMAKAALDAERQRLELLKQRERKIVRTKTDQEVRDIKHQDKKERRAQKDERRQKWMIKRHELEIAKIEAKKENQKRRQRTLMVMGICVIVVAVLLLILYTTQMSGFTQGMNLR